VKIIENEDPDPIYLCQLMKACAEVDGGVASITKTVINPKSGPVGTIFNFGFTYNVTKQTGPGLVLLEIVDPNGLSFGEADFVDTQAPGLYQAGPWQVQAEPSEDEPFSPGLYQVQFAFCEGDCTNKHPYGGVYSSALGSFNLTQ